MEPHRNWLLFTYRSTSCWAKPACSDSLGEWMHLCLFFLYPQSTHLSLYLWQERGRWSPGNMCAVIYWGKWILFYTLYFEIGNIHKKYLLKGESHHFFHIKSSFLSDQIRTACNYVIMWKAVKYLVKQIWFSRNNKLMISLTWGMKRVVSSLCCCPHGPCI